MSKYSGKCDFYDTISLYGIDYIKNSDVYVGSFSTKNRNHKIKINSSKDCIPYYPFIISCAGFNKDKSTIYLSDESWVDIEEKEWLNRWLAEILKEYDRCKRKKAPFDEEIVFEKLCFGLIDLGFRRSLYSHDTELREIISRVAKYSKKATVKGIHLGTKNNLYREPLYEEMVKNGYSKEYAKEWIYGKEKK